ncbi:hypothetical protein ALC56_10073 [Trachymyrmex septentrionalis]|uniref:Secreted protein n=1 Tax=Trachymyrmex septentrionalis TaxID=34720 RepID=A0A195F544_9HYME|nr:hypothetical protein ALC56_10073 [Trachymyrmex septentrionalis]
MQSLRYLLLPFQFLLIFQLTRNTEHKKKERVSRESVAKESHISSRQPRLSEGGKKARMKRQGEVKKKV